MKKLLIFVVLFFIGVNAHSQDFFREYLPIWDQDIHRFEHIEHSELQNEYYAVGSTGNFASVFRIGLDGNVIASIRLGNSESPSSFFDFVFAPDGDLLVVGTRENPKNINNHDPINDVIIYRIAPDLQLVWNNVNNVFTNSTPLVLGADATRVVRPRIVAVNGNYVVNFLSDVSTNGGGQSDKLSLIGINGTGTILWRNQYGTTTTNGSITPDDQIYEVISHPAALIFTGNIAANNSGQNTNNAYLGMLDSGNGNLFNGPFLNQLSINNGTGSRFHGLLLVDNDLFICGSDINNSITGNGIIGRPSSGSAKIFRNSVGNTTLSSMVSVGDNFIATTNTNPNGNAEVYVFDNDMGYQSSFEISDFNLPANFKLTTAPNNRIILYGNFGDNAYMTVLDPLDFTAICNANPTERTFIPASVSSTDLKFATNFPLGLTLNQEHNFIVQKKFKELPCILLPESEDPKKRHRDLFIENENGQNQTNIFKIFPNPNSGQFNVRLEKEHGAMEINIYDTIGNHVKQVKLNKDDLVVSINLDTVQSGFYIIQVKSEKEIFETQKVFIDKP